MATTTERPALDPLDYLAIDALLDDEERAIRDTVRQFVRDNVLDEVGDWSRKASSRARYSRSSRSSVCSGCTSTATASPAPAPSPTA